MISVIIPVYNAAKYIDNCINSIRKQTYTDYEIVLVDDGSKDDSAAICDKWANEYSNITVIHKTNGGVSSARNEGIKAANGEYMLFLDADDSLKADALEKLIGSIALPEVVIGGFEFVYEEHSVSRSTGFNGVVTCEEFRKNHFKKMYDSRILFAPANKLFRSSLIKDNNILFDQNLTINEDILFAVECLMKADKVAVVDSIIYEYNQTNINSTLSKYQPRFIESTVAYLKKIIGLLGKADQMELVSGHVMRAFRQEYRLIRTEERKKIVERFGLLRECVKTLSICKILFSGKVNKDARLVCLLLKLKAYSLLYSYGLKKMKGNNAYQIENSVAVKRQELSSKLASYIEDNYVEADYFELNCIEDGLEDECNAKICCDEEYGVKPQKEKASTIKYAGAAPKAMANPMPMAAPMMSEPALKELNPTEDEFQERLESGLRRRMAHMDDSFADYLFYLIEEKGLKNSTVYTDAAVDKKTFSKIKNDPDYHPSKRTALCLCIGAKLNLDQSKDLLSHAGFALSNSDKTDVIFSFFIENELYDIQELDIQLEEYGQPSIIPS